MTESKHFLWTLSCDRQLVREEVEAPCDKDLFEMAATGRFGYLDGIMGIVDGETVIDALAYKWALVAADLGVPDAQVAIEDILNASALIHDDDQVLAGGVHFDLGMAYLTLDHGLPMNTELAVKHLREAKLRLFPIGDFGNGAEVLANARKRLNSDCLMIFNAVFL